MNELIETPRVSPTPRRLTDAEFQGLAAIPPEVEWFANIRNPNTKAAYERDVKDFAAFVGVQTPEDFRNVTRAHVIAWRDTLEQAQREAATIRRKLSALSSLYTFLSEKNAVTYNPVIGVTRPKEGANQGKTPAISDAQARALLEAADTRTLMGKRDKAMVSVFLYHAIREDELVKLRIKDISERQGIKHLTIRGKGEKIRYIPASPLSLRLIEDYLAEADHRDDKDGALFRPTRNNRSQETNKPLSGRHVRHVIAQYGEKVGITAAVEGFCVHALRATAITNALEHQADIAKVQEWAGHNNIATTRLYDRRETRPEDSPTYRVRY